MVYNQLPTDPEALMCCNGCSQTAALIYRALEKKNHALSIFVIQPPFMVPGIE